MKRLLCFFAALSLLWTMASADGSMARLMSQNDARIDSVFLGQSHNTRLDLIDYYNAGSKTFTADSQFGSKLRIDSLSDRYARFSGNIPVELEAYLLTPASDSLMVWVVNMPLGEGDCVVYVDDVRTGRTIQTIDTDYTEWLVKEAAKEANQATLLAIIPFVNVSVQVDPYTNVVTMTNTTVDTPGLDPAVTAFFRPTLRYRWNGKKFVPEK